MYQEVKRVPSLNHEKVGIMILPDEVLMRQAQYLSIRG